MVSLAPKRINAFILAPDHSLHWTYKDPANDTNWAGWHQNGGKWIYEPVTVSRAMNYLTAFMVAEDQSLHQAHFDLVQWGDFGPFNNIGGKLIAPPAVTNRKGTLHILHIGTDRALHHKSWDGQTYTPAGKEYEKLDGAFTHTPTAVTTGPSDVSVFAVGHQDNALYHYHWHVDSRWSKSEKLPGHWAESPKAVSAQPGHVDVFGIDSEGNVIRVSFQNGRHSGLETIHGKFHGINAVSPQPGVIDIFALDASNVPHHRRWQGRAWQAWESMGGILVQPPTPVSHSPGAVTLLGLGLDTGMWFNVRNIGTGKWEGWKYLGARSISRVG
ncbi:hypothetical protein JB92DRAFT_583484 [Gautieria morchelliformis]|nr:hypothetical protein JB92DRAFT_583484 [Gautieria morchelliformis]